MRPFEDLTDNQIRAKISHLTADINYRLSLVGMLRSALVARDAEVALVEAQKAIDRAKSGVCTKGVGDCPVHQMGSCKSDETEPCYFCRSRDISHFANTIDGYYRCINCKRVVTALYLNSRTGE